MKTTHTLSRFHYSLAKLLAFIIYDHYAYYSEPMPPLKFTNQQMRALAGKDNGPGDYEVKWINEALSDDHLILLKFESYWILAPCFAKNPISLPPGLLRNFYAGYTDVYFETDEDEVTTDDNEVATDEGEAADDDEDEAA